MTLIKLLTLGSSKQILLLFHDAYGTLFIRRSIYSISYDIHLHEQNSLPSYLALLYHVIHSSTTKLPDVIFGSSMSSDTLLHDQNSLSSYLVYYLRFLVFNSTFNDISAISCGSILLVEEIWHLVPAS